jgi:hypothetical protein
MIISVFGWSEIRMEHLREQQLDRDKRILEEKIRQYVEQLTKCQNDHHNQKVAMP